MEEQDGFNDAADHVKADPGGTRQQNGTVPSEEPVPASLESLKLSITKDAVVDTTPSDDAGAAAAATNKFYFPVAGLAVALVAILTVRLGILSVLLILVAAFLLSAIPEFRYIVDGTVAAAPSPEQRLAAAFPSLLTDSSSSPKPSDAPLSSSASAAASSSADHISALPPSLCSAFETLIHLVVRDFVENWYLLPSVSTGSPSFPLLVRSLLRRCVAHGHARIASKNGRETAVYLLGCISMTIVRELNEVAPSSSSGGSTSALNLGRDMGEEAVKSRAERRRRQTRAIAEEVVLTLIPSSLANPDVTRSLLTEILAVQLENTVGAFGEDWINQTIVATLGNGEPEVKDEVKGGRRRKSSGIAVPEALKEVVGEVGEAVDEAVKESQVLDDRELAEALNDQPLATGPGKRSGYRLPSTARELTSSYLDPPDAVSRAQLIASLHSTPVPFPRWAPTSLALGSLLPSLLSQQPCDEDLASALMSFVDSSPQSATLVRLWTQLGSFAHVIRLTKATPDVRRRDAKAILRRAADTLLDATGKTNEAEDLKSVLASTILAIENDVDSEESPFELLQIWLIDQLERGEAGGYLRKHQQAAADAATRNAVARKVSKNPPTSPRNPPAKQGVAVPYRFAAMELPKDITPASSLPPPTEPSLSLAGLDLGRRGGRDRSASFSRTATSPPGSDWGSPAKLKKGAVHTVKEGIPEESDMTEVFSLDSPTDSIEADGPQPEELVGGRPRGESSASAQSSTPAQTSSEAPSVSPHFVVSVTDISNPSAWDAKGHVRQKRDLEFVIAVEASGLPGFIVTRKWTEAEKMDTEVHRLLGAGTVDSPRALLPSLPYKTSETLGRALETYLGSLLREPRYATAPPVVNFFARERAGSAQDPALRALGKGVTTLGTAVGEGVNKGFAMPANLATQGFSQLSKGLGLPFGNKRRSESNASLPLSRSSIASGSRPALSSANSHLTSTSSLPLGGSQESLANRANPQEKVASLPEQPSGSEESVVSSLRESILKEPAEGYTVDEPAEIASPVSSVRSGTSAAIQSPAPIPLPQPVSVSAKPTPPSLPYAVRQPRSPPSPASSMSSASRAPPSGTASKSDTPKSKGDVPSILSFDPPSGLQTITKPVGSLFGAIGHALDAIVPDDAGPAKPPWGSVNPYDLGQQGRSVDVGSRSQSPRSSFDAGASAPSKRGSSEAPKVPRLQGGRGPGADAGRSLRAAERTRNVITTLPPIPPTPAGQIADPVRASSVAEQASGQAPPSVNGSTAESTAISVPAVEADPSSASVSDKGKANGAIPAVEQPRRRVTAPVKTATLLTQADFDNIVTSAMAVLEAAYGLTSQWSMKRGVFRVLETVLRSSYAGVIKSSVGSLIDSASDPDAISARLDGLRDSFWPDGVWWSSAPGFVHEERTDEDKVKTKQEARRLFIASWDGLKLALGGAATSQAAGQLFDVLQGEGATILAHAVVMDLVRLLVLL